MSQDRLDECQQILGYAFKEPSHLKIALTHSSIKSESAPSNERMEFLGDSVLGAIVSQYLFENYPDYDEGELSRIKSVVVSSPILARESKRLRLTRFLFVGKGMLKQGRFPSSLLANALEAIVAAIFLDRGMNAARTFVIQRLRDQIEAVVRNQHRMNFKSILQHHCQKEFNVTPTYRVVRVQGPDHSKYFEVITILGEREMKSGGGLTKKDAEQKAAEATYRALEGRGESVPRVAKV